MRRVSAFYRKSCGKTIYPLLLFVVSLAFCSPTGAVGAAGTNTLTVQSGWNLIGLPAIPLNSDPVSVFADIGGTPAIDGMLTRYDAIGGNYTYMEIDPAEFGNMLLGEDYWFYATANDQEVTYPSASVDCNRWISLPKAGWTVIGYPRDDTGVTAYDQLYVANNHEVKTMADAVDAGWIQDTAYWFDPTLQSIRTIGLPSGFPDTSTFQSGHGYEFYGLVDNLMVVFPANPGTPPPGTPTSGSIPDAKTSCDGSSVNLTGKIVTATFPAEGYCYIQEPAPGFAGVRLAGVTAYAPGTILDVDGTMATDPGGERVIQPTQVQQAAGTETPQPAGMNNRDLLSGALIGDTCSEAGADRGMGQHHIGTLVTTWGKVTAVSTGSFYVWDGAGPVGSPGQPITDESGNSGIRVETPGGYAGYSPAVGDYVVVTGIGGLRHPDNNYYTVIRMASLQSALRGASSVLAALSYPAQEWVTLTDVIVTTDDAYNAQDFSSRFYVEDPNRGAALMVHDNGQVPGVSRGDIVTILGWVWDDMSFGDNPKEAYIEPYWATITGHTEPLEPVNMNNRALGGNDLATPDGGIYYGVTYPPPYGLYNKGMLVTTWGTVTTVDEIEHEFWIDDGSALPVREGSQFGVKVTYDWWYTAEGQVIETPRPPSLGTFVKVTGICTGHILWNFPDDVMRTIRPRRGDDVIDAGLGVPSDVVTMCTGTNKITVYWQGVEDATGYNVYRSVEGSSALPVLLTATPTNNLDPGPGLTNEYMFSDTTATAGVQYGYAVAAVNADGIRGDLSDPSTAEVEANPVPWDTGDAAIITEALHQYLTLDGTDTDVGQLTVCGPDGVIYEEYSDQPPQVLPPVGYFNVDAARIEFADGTTSPVSMDPALDDGSTSGMSTLSYAGYGPTNPPSGIYRKVAAVPGYSGLTAHLLLPCTAAQCAKVGSAVGEQNPYQDQAYIYTGATGAGWDVDAGLQLGNTGNEGWKPYMHAKRGHTMRKPVSSGTFWVPSGNNVDMYFVTPGYYNVPSKTAQLSFKMTSPGITHEFKLNGMPVTEMLARKTFLLPVDGWTPSSTLMIKRCNSIAQDMQTLQDNHLTFAQTGSYILGAGWGSQSPDAPVELLGRAGTTAPWLEPETANQGSYPGSPYITWRPLVPFSVEDQIDLRTNP